MRRIHLAIAVLSVLALLAPPASAESGAQDGVVREVVRMLEAGVTEDVILRWLERGHRRPETLGADDIIALTEAEASPELMDALMAVPEPVADPPAIPEPEPEGAEPAAPSADEIPVDFSIRYRPFRDPEGEEDEQWHLFVYLDGNPLAWSEGKNWLTRKKQTVDVTPLLTPGRHVVRLAQERHRRWGKKGWRHEARVCPDALEIDARPGLRVDIQITEPVGLGLSSSGTFVWGLWDEGTPLDEGNPLEGPPGNWPPLCDEIESSYDEGDKIPKRVRKELDRCVRWDSLWPGVDGAPSRDEVRALLERFDYRPAVAD